MMKAYIGVKFLSNQDQYVFEETSTWDRWFQELDNLHLITIHHFGLQSASIDFRRPVARKQAYRQDCI